jgi:Nucleoside-diphosphate-sugar pyrophosphorylase involved in lipopolysaccharide biosynthesis/translation initiation factor 2B, gamma/epsilon subunits (eIF-2Bgamma/eIF-2Bepsilon)
VTLVDTGDHTMTGGRVKRIQSYVNGEPFLLTYGDGVADLNIAQLVAFHQAHRKHVTVTATQPIGRFGALTLERDNIVKNFMEKPIGDGGWINGGFFVMQPEVFRYIIDDSTTLERDPMEKLAGEGELVAFKHYGFWQAMDTLRDKIHLEDLWASNKAPWKLW